MDARKMLAIAALVLAGLALQAAFLHHCVAVPLVSALRATRVEARAGPAEATPRPELTEEIEVVAPRRAAEPAPDDEARVAGAR